MREKRASRMVRRTWTGMAGCPMVLFATVTTVDGVKAVATGGGYSTAQGLTASSGPVTIGNIIVQ